MKPLDQKLEGIVMPEGKAPWGTRVNRQNG